MEAVLETNIYDAKGRVLIYGSCLPRMEEEGFKKLAQEYDVAMSLCLEKDHINMAITKICGMISTRNITFLTFASVNRSPHCTQMHYIKHEIERMMPAEIIPEINDIIIQNGVIHVIEDEVLDLSKDLINLSALYKKAK